MLMSMHVACGLWARAPFHCNKPVLLPHIVSPAMPCPCAALGVEVGQGVLIKVLDASDEASPKLSAPLPVQAHKVGLSLHIGGCKLDVIHAFYEVFAFYEALLRTPLQLPSHGFPPPLPPRSCANPSSLPPHCCCNNPA